jgi:hypothetical protein
MPLARCPTCRSQVDTAASVDAEHNPTPGPDSLCICFYCGALNRYTPSLTLETFPSEDFSLLPIEVRKEVWVAQDAIHEFLKWKERNCP